MSQERIEKSLCILEATGLSAVLGGHKVLEIPSFKINSNEVLMIIGPNGSGKSTLLLCLALLLNPTTGTISYNGIPITGSNHILQMRRKFAVVFQDPLLLNNTVWDNVILGMKLRGVSKEESKYRAEKWLERFGITTLAKRQARTLSGGEAKRVSLARAFALQPDILFMDEPFSALDSPTRHALLEDFENVLRETKVTTVMVTHDRDEVLMLADRVAVLMNGSICQLGTPEEVFSSPVDEDVARFVEAGNILHGVVSSQSNGLAVVNVEGLEIQVVSKLASGSRVTVYLNFDDITLTLPLVESLRTSARNQLRGKIIKSFPLGSQMKVTINCGSNLASVITRRSWEELGLETGKEIVASFKASSVHLIAE